MHNFINYFSIYKKITLGQKYFASLSIISIL